MLFNSYEFIFLFFVPVFVAFNYIGNYRAKVWFLVLVSIVFYAQWSLVHLAILLLSIVLNYFISWVLVSFRYQKAILFLGIGTNLAPLVYFKYSYFLHLSSEQLVLPLAISFFTFQQIAYLVDLYKKRISFGDFKEYALFILFFPQLVAGPIVHYKEIVPQIENSFKTKIKDSFVVAGLILFCIGLFKKVVLADSFAPVVDSAFLNIETISSYDAWIGIFSYTFLIYFDFSGYADMAIGLALMFGVRLPSNFNSPYKARNISEFWRNWHITLSNFLKDYIYIPLGGNRFGYLRQILSLVLTMVIGGIWHGAGWNFLLWGFMHGVFLAITHYFKTLLKKEFLFPRFVAVLITFFCVTLLWVLFRAQSFDIALKYYEVLFAFDLRFEFAYKNIVDVLYSKELLVFCGFVVVWFLPNSLMIIKYSSDKFDISYKKIFFAAILFFVALKAMVSKAAAAFVYFNF